MSYSSQVTGRTKAEAKLRIAEEFEKVVASQPMHAADKDAAVVCGQAFVDMLVDPQDGEEIHVAIHGSLGWRAENEFIGAGVSVHALIRKKTE